MTNARFGTSASLGPVQNLRPPRNFHKSYELFHNTLTCYPTISASLRPVEGFRHSAKKRKENYKPRFGPVQV